MYKNTCRIVRIYMYMDQEKGSSKWKRVRSLSNRLAPYFYPRISLSLFTEKKKEGVREGEGRGGERVHDFQSVPFPATTKFHAFYTYESRYAPTTNSSIPSADSIGRAVSVFFLIPFFFKFLRSFPCHV
uniref:Uncharacterized protein n=1 Tax=Glypta fumiferanae TaxID=389681 RepID=A0A0F6Q786_9HYME|nr:hypothetical protein [Glypta fumiferanae]